MTKQQPWVLQKEKLRILDFARKKHNRRSYIAPKHYCFVLQTDIVFILWRHIALMQTQSLYSNLIQIDVFYICVC